MAVKPKKPKGLKITLPANGAALTVGQAQAIKFTGKNHETDPNRAIYAMVQIFYRVNGVPYMLHPLGKKGQLTVKSTGNEDVENPANLSFQPANVGRYTLRVIAWNGKDKPSKPTSGKDHARTLISVRVKNP